MIITFINNIADHNNINHNFNYNELNNYDISYANLLTHDFNNHINHPYHESIISICIIIFFLICKNILNIIL